MGKEKRKSNQYAQEMELRGPGDAAERGLKDESTGLIKREKKDLKNPRAGVHPAPLSATIPLQSAITDTLTLRERRVLLLQRIGNPP